MKTFVFCKGFRKKKNKKREVFYPLFPNYTEAQTLTISLVDPVDWVLQ